MSIKGFATAEGTRRYRERFEGKSTGGLPIAEGHFRDTTQGLSLTSLGMGTYLGNLDEQTSRDMTQAAIRSVSSGAINVLDTAINYRYQLSERSLAQAIKDLLSQGFQRDELFVCSKNGFISPDAERQQRGEDFREWFRSRYIDSEMIQPGDIAGGMHCMAPAYLEDQLSQSLSNLGLATLDLVYLHNAAESQLPEVGREEFMRRLRLAFEFYEKARAEGRIRYYGMATWNCFRVEPEESGEYLSLQEVVALASSVGGESHGFRFIQLPFNLAFTEALTLPAQPVDAEMMSLLEAAMAFDIGVFTSVPLLQGQLLSETRLPKFDGMETPAQECLQFVRSNPGVLAPLVGHKKPAHVEQNLKVASLPPLVLAEFEEMLST
ncbi:MAG: oxidoreductase [Vampirovibrio sp.]|jgi:aryl-alcohol dehydrogenase-like predicted oxidoreductase|nr:oxidoreductase [Vampirovibrio sp.]